MTNQSTDESLLRTTAFVRRHAGSAAIAAALMLFFGFAYLGKPDGTDLFARTWLVLYYTLRLGGIAMVAIAVWLWTGHRLALAADAVLAIVVGALLILTGLGMLAGGGDSMQMIINVVCGWMFFSSGLRKGREYFELAAVGVRVTDETTVKSAAPVETQGAVEYPTQLRRGQSPGRTEEPLSLGDQSRPVPPPASVGGEPESAADDQAQAAPRPPPSEGYLASFAKKPPDRQDE